jgi:predicted O-linked N-acetylglucosamine transferase (SPINDLY family)
MTPTQTAQVELNQSDEANHLFSIGLQFHKQGNLDHAEQHYRQALAIEEDHTDAIHNLGLIFQQKGDRATAMQYITRALETQPNHAGAHNNFGILLKEAGEIQDAIARFRLSLSINPSDVGVIINLASALQQVEQFQEAQQLWEKVIDRGLQDEHVFCNLGILYERQDNWDGAETIYRKALNDNPNQPAILTNLGTVLQKRESVEEAWDCYQKALAINANNPEALSNMAALLQEQGRFEEALSILNNALEIAPNAPQVNNNLGSLYHKMGEYAKSIQTLQQAIEHKPQYPEAWNNLGISYREAGKLSESIIAFSQSIKLMPVFAEAHYNLGNSYKEQGYLKEAIAAYYAAITHKPDYAEALLAYIHQRQHICDWNGLESYIAQLKNLVMKEGATVSPFSFLSIPGTTHQEQHQCAKQWSAKHYPLAALSEHTALQDKSVLKIGYLSADFHEHATAYLTAEMFERHDRMRFEIHAYSYGPDDQSPMRGRLERAFDHFHDISEYSHEEAAKQIRNDGIDILVDLKGFTGSARPQILRYRPAPIQVNYLGYPGTMGFDAMDYILVDQHVVQQEEQSFYSETLVQLPDSYQVNDSKRQKAGAPSREDCGLPKRGFVFCSFNNNYKICPTMFNAWMELLDAVPGSVLWLLKSNPMSEENLRTIAHTHGISPHRIIFAEKVPLAEHMARHTHADLFLDTLHYNAHTTASDALWNNVPLITFPGETFSSRVAASLLHTVGLQELIVDSLDSYKALALMLANEPKRLNALKKQLAHYVKTQPLFNTKRFTSNLEEAYQAVYKQRLEGKKELIQLESVVIPL